MSDEADELDRAWVDAEHTLLAVFVGDARAHLRVLEAKRDGAESDAARAVWAVAPVIACRFDEASVHADRALRSATDPASAEHRLAAAAVSMTEAMAGAPPERGPRPDLPPSDEPGRGALLVCYLRAEAALSSGAFDVADALISDAGLEPGQVVAPGAPPDAPVDGAALTLQLLWARSSAFHGRAARVRAIHDGIQARSADVPPRAHLVFVAIGCYGAALAADRDRAGALADA